jgi:hypothetical protein
MRSCRSWAILGFEEWRPTLSTTTAVHVKWEYRLEAFDFSPLEMEFDDPMELNVLGAQGWELVSVQSNPMEGAAPFLCIFKRPSA